MNDDMPTNALHENPESSKNMFAGRDTREGKNTTQNRNECLLLI
jgi:hypothetical protein